MQNEKVKLRDDQTSGTPTGSSDRLDRNMGTGCLLEAVLVPLDGLPPALVLVYWPVSVISSTLWPLKHIWICSAQNESDDDLLGIFCLDF